MPEAEVHRHDERSADITVPESGPDERLDKYLTAFFPELSRSRIQEGIQDEEVTVDGRPVSKSYGVSGGETIECRFSPPDPIAAEPQAIPIEVVYEDEAVIVVDKAAGMVVHPAPGHPDGTLVNALLHHVGAPALTIEEAKQASEDTPTRASEDTPQESSAETPKRASGEAGEEEPGAVGLSTVQAAARESDRPVLRPGIVHRLDMDTSGLLVVAKTDSAHRTLAEAFKRHDVDRQYQALVWGHPEPEADTIDAPIGRDPHHRTRQAVTDRHAGKRAVTHYRVQARRGPIALVAYRLETGRTHQIRVHSQFAGHPVVGDSKYGGRGIKYGPRHGPRREELEAVIGEIDRQALHARVLGFTHPETGEELRFTSDWPEDMLAVWRGLRSFDES